MPSKIIAHK